MTARDRFEPDHQTLLDIYRRVALLHANDERARKVIRSGQIAMVYYSYRGQEIIPAALSAVLRDDDYLCTIYRGIHDMLAKGFPLDLLWAELAGNRDRRLTHPKGMRRVMTPRYRAAGFPAPRGTRRGSATGHAAGLPAGVRACR